MKRRVKPSPPQVETTPDPVPPRRWNHDRLLPTCPGGGWSRSADDVLRCTLHGISDDEHDIDGVPIR